MLRKLGEFGDEAGRRMVADRSLGTLTSKATKRVLARNIELLGRHADQRAFVIGAAPSLRGVDLSPLASEVVIAVNQTFLHLRKVGVAPTYIMAIDDRYYDPDMRGYIDDICAYALEVGAELFVTPRFEDIATELSVVPTYHVIGQIMRSRDFGFGGSAQDIDLTLAQPGFETVMHAAVAAAIYMRVSEICIMGCDGDFFTAPHRPFDHVYGSSPYDLREGSTSELFNETQPELLRRAAFEFEAFTRLAEIAARHGLIVYNAGRGGHLEVLPRRSFAELTEQRFGVSRQVSS